MSDFVSLIIGAPFIMDPHAVIESPFAMNSKKLIEYSLLFLSHVLLSVFLVASFPIPALVLPYLLIPTTAWAAFRFNGG